MDTKDFSLDELAISLVDSLNELREVLKSSKLNLIFGDSEEGLNGFYHLTFKDFNGSVGLCSFSQGKFSGCRKFNDRILIFNDQMLYAVNRELNIEWKTRTDGMIYDIVIPSDKIVVVHEIGIKCFSANGETLWSHSTDIISDYNIVNEILTIKTDEGSQDISLID